MTKEPELPIRIIRETHKQKRRTASHGFKEKQADRPQEVQASKTVITHRVNEQDRLQSQNFKRRVAFRSVVTDESLRRRRIAAGEQRREQLVGDVGKQSGVRSAGIGFATGIIRVFVVIFALSMLFLLVSRGQQTGTAIQKVGYFLNNITTAQPLFKKKEVAAK